MTDDTTEGTILTRDGYTMDNVNPLSKSQLDRVLAQPGDRVLLVQDDTHGHFGEEAIVVGVGGGYGVFYGGQVVYDIVKVEDDTNDPIFENDDPEVKNPPFGGQVERITDQSIDEVIGSV